MLPPTETIIIITAVVFAARFLESIMGFGGTVLALPLLALLVPGLEITGFLVPVLALGNIACCAGIVFVGRRDIVWREYGVIILWMAVGLPAGFLLAGVAPEPLLRLILGGFVLFIAIGRLHETIRKGHTDPGAEGPLTRLYLRTVLVLGGVVHGIFTTGGPLLVIYATRVLKTKGLFRVTLAMVWLTLNIVMAAGWIADGRIAPGAWTVAGITIPFILVAVFLGDYLHHRLPEEAFRKVAYVLLLLAGVSLVHKSLPLVLGGPPPI